MSKSERAGQVSSGTDRPDQFAPVGAPTPMTEADLRACAQPNGPIAEDQRAVYAVARRTGVVYNAAAGREYEALNVLYLTADGEQAVERWYARTSPDALDAVDRAMAVDEAALTPAGEPARRFAPITQRHPEVEG